VLLPWSSKCKNHRIGAGHRARPRLTVESGACQLATRYANHDIRRFMSSQAARSASAVNWACPTISIVSRRWTRPLRAKRPVETSTSKQLVAGHEGVDCEQPLRWGSVEDNVIVLFLNLAQGRPQPLAAVVEGSSQLPIHTGEADGSRAARRRLPRPDVCQQGYPLVMNLP
jgi:hypothetical protein